MRWPALIAASVVAAGLLVRTAAAQPYATLASQPDPRDFIARDGTHLTVLGAPLRFAGYDIAWLGVGADGGMPAAGPTPYEVADALATVQTLGGTIVRSRPMAAIASADGITRPDPAWLAGLDLVLKTARDMGLKVIVPLAGAAHTECAAASPDPGCAYVLGRRLQDPAAFFADSSVRADFLAGAVSVLDHVNALTGIAYRDDPTILAWENCLACAGRAPPAATAAWSEQLGQALKAADPRHLYEDGAFAGRIGMADGVAAALYATPSVDIVGDMLATGGDADAARPRLDATARQVADLAKVYVLDSIGWTPALWKTREALEAWNTSLLRQRSLTGVIIGRLQGHAQAGGFLPPAPAVPAQGVASLYFPGIRTADMDADEMQARGRALRRLAYGLLELTLIPAYLLPPPPQIIGAAHSHLTWRGAAGAVSYTIERSPDPSAPATWTVVCDACATDMGGGWQDPAPTYPAWYRITPANANGHRSVPSEPVQATK